MSLEDPHEPRKVKSESEFAQSFPTLCDPMDCSLPGSPIHGILQARMLEWVSVPFSRDLPDPGIEPRSPTLAGVFFTTNTTWEVLIIIIWHLNILSYSKQVGREIVSRLNFLVENAQNSPWNVIQIFIFMTGNLFKNPCNMHPLFRWENCRCLASGHGMWVAGPGQDTLELQLIWYTTWFCQEIWKNK